MRGADAIVLLLEELAVEVIFGLCGDTSLPMYEALSESDKIRLVLTRDERSASFMADVYARLSGRVGVCEGPSGGGATYILPGVAEANESFLPSDIRVAKVSDQPKAVEKKVNEVVGNVVTSVVVVVLVLLLMAGLRTATIATIALFDIGRCGACTEELAATSVTVVRVVSLR